MTLNLFYEVQRELVKLLNKTIPTITKFEYFSDGCAAQYKNFKDMLNWCRNKVDFGIEATWSNESWEITM